MLRGEVSRISVDYMLTPEELTDVTLVGDAHVMGEITNEAGYMRLTLEATLNYEGECARCLSLVKDVFVMQFERTVADEGTLTDEQLEDNVDEYVIIQNGELDLDEEIDSVTVGGWAMEVLGKIPEVGDSFEEYGIAVEVTENGRQTC